MMIINRMAGFLSIILGIIFIISPMFSAGLVSVIVGLSLLFFGITAAFMGWTMRNEVDNFLPDVILAIGIISLIFGFLFIFYIDALSFLIGLQFYIVGFIMIFFGIAGLLSNLTPVSRYSSLLVLLMGIVAILLAIFAVTQPVYIATIIGIVLIIEGIALVTSI